MRKVSTDAVLAYIKRQKAVTFEELVSKFQCSYMTILRKKGEIGYITSYNRYNSGLTLRDIPVFNEFGIWDHRALFFSKWGDLRRTLKEVVDISPEGLSAGDLHDIMKIRINNHLSVCVNENLIVRNHDFGRPVYFSTDHTVRNQQFERRTAIHRREHPIEKPLLSCENIIMVLLVIIESHATTVDRLVPILEQKGIHFTEQSIRWLFNKYQIEKKGSL